MTHFYGETSMSARSANYKLSLQAALESSLRASGSFAGDPYGVGDLTDSDERPAPTATEQFPRKQFQQQASTTQRQLLPSQPPNSNLSQPPQSEIQRAAEPRAGEDGPLRIVHLGPCFTRGGAEQSFIDLARFLNPARLQVAKCIATQGKLVNPKVVAEMNAPVEVGGVDAVRRACDEHHILVYWGIALDKWLQGWKPKLAVYLAHGESHWTRDLLVGSTQTVDHAIAVSQRAAERTCQGFPHTVILNGVDSARLAQSRSRSEVRQSLGFRHDDFVLGFVGRLSAEKRPGVLIDAVARLPINFKALLVGKGQMQAELLELANARIPGRFAIVAADSHLGDYYQALDTFCLTSAHEGFALVILEAMMSGRPVIATAVGVAPEILVDHVNGLIIPGDAAALASAAQRLHDFPEWARGLATQGRAFAEQFGHATRMARQYEDLFESLWRQKHFGLRQGAAPRG
jgi:glycosyltransferase involved in cell wall biosynthesis